MKKNILLTLIMLMAASFVSFAADKAPKKTKSTKNYYYVVIASFEDLDVAIRFNDNGPCDTTFGNVYSAVVNGKTVYRVCLPRYTSLASAKRGAKDFTDGIYPFWGKMDTWIWTSKGPAKCVYRGVDVGDNIMPL